MFRSITLILAALFVTIAALAASPAQARHENAPAAELASSSGATCITDSNSRVECDPRHEDPTTTTLDPPAPGL